MSRCNDVPLRTPASAKAAKVAGEIERDALRRDTGIVVNADGFTPRSARLYRKHETDKRRSA